MKKELKIEIPEGYEIDKENSTFEKIVFKEKTIKWRNNSLNRITGWWIDSKSIIRTNCVLNQPENYNLFATGPLATKALAMAKISQILVNDQRFGQCYFKGFCGRIIYQIKADNQKPYPSAKIVQCDVSEWDHDLLVFDTANQAALFIEENWDLLLDYFTVKMLCSPYIHE